MTDDPDDDDRPWEKPGAVRRDCEPHRSHVLEWLAWASLVGGLVAFGPVAALFFGSPLPVSVPLVTAGAILAVTAPLGLVARVLAGRDIAKMRAGLMDPAGMHPARVVRIMGLFGLALGIFNTAAAVGTFGLNIIFFGVAAGSVLVFAYVAART